MTCHLPYTQLSITREVVGNDLVPRDKSRLTVCLCLPSLSVSIYLPQTTHLSTLSFHPPPSFIFDILFLLLKHIERVSLSAMSVFLAEAKSLGNVP